jgi:hypothetical protein
MRLRQPVIDDGNLLARVAESVHNLVLHHARIRNHMPCAATLEQVAFQLEEFAMFSVHEPKKSAPARLMRNAVFQPKLVNAIPGPVTIAFPNPFETVQRFVRLPRGLDRFCKLLRA